jgi:hypothetical protein
VTGFVVAMIAGLAAVVIVGVPLVVAAVLGEVLGGGTAEGRHLFTDVAGGAGCVLVVPAGGAVYPRPGQPKIGVSHPGCGLLADLAVELDAFYCPGCRYNGRVPGGWCRDVIDAEAGA